MNGEVHLDVDPILEGHQSRSHLEPPSSSEFQSEDLEYGSLRCCRICFGHETHNDDELISPCMCKGTQKAVHRSCLDNWRSVKEGSAFLNCTTCKARYHLRVVEIKEDPWRKAKFKLLVTRDVLLIFLAVQTVIVVFGVLAYLINKYLIIKDRRFQRSLHGQWDRLLSKYPIPLYYCSGLFGLLAIVGVFGLIWSAVNIDDPEVARHQNKWYTFPNVHCNEHQTKEGCFFMIIFFAIFGIPYGIIGSTIALRKIMKKHYHILNKKELTQEYIVKDLRGFYFTPPKLDAEHEKRLKLLNLL